MGILKYSVEDSKKIVINDANNVPMIGDDGQPVVIEIYSPGSKQYASAQSKRNSQIMNLAKQQGKIQANPDLELLQDANYLADIVKKAPSNIGEDFPGLSHRELLIALFTSRPLGYICEQIRKELSDWANFTNSSSPN